MNAHLKPGYDGRPTTIEPIRDPDGEGKREIFREARMDTVERLFRKGDIHEYQRDAARLLQRDAARAELRARSSNDGIPIQRTRFALSDAQDKARAADYDARRAVEIAMGRAGTLGSTLLRLVVIQELSLQQSAEIMREDHRSISTALRFSLDCLARHYGLA